MGAAATVLVIVDSNLDIPGAELVNTHLSKFVRSKGHLIYSRVLAVGDPSTKAQALITDGYVQRTFTSPTSVKSVDAKGLSLLDYLKDSSSGIIDVAGVGDNVRTIAFDLKTAGFDVSVWPSMFTLGNKKANDALIKEVVVH